MSQQGFTIVSLKSEVTEMGDLEFIQEKVLAGDYFQVTGNINSVTDTIEYTVPNNKTAFLIEAKITHKAITPTSNTPTSLYTIADLKIDSDVKDSTQFQAITKPAFAGNIEGGGGFGETMNRFNVKGLSLVGNNSKKIEIENVLGNTTTIATMSGYLVDT